MDRDFVPSDRDQVVASLTHQGGARMVAGYLASLALVEYQCAVRTNEAATLLAKVGLQLSDIVTFLQRGEGSSQVKAGNDVRVTVTQRIYLLGVWLNHQKGVYLPQLFASPVVAFSFQIEEFSPHRLSDVQQECLTGLIFPDVGQGEKPADPVWKLIQELESI